MAKAKTDIVGVAQPLEVKRKGDKIWSHVRQAWYVETPEERVRQEYLCVLVNEYGYSLDQIAEEETIPGLGSGSARADLVVWRAIRDKTDQHPLIVVECKADNGPLSSFRSALAIHGIVHLN